VCAQFTPQVALRGNEALFLEISQCRRLYDEEGLLLRLRVLLRRFGFQAKIVVGTHAAEALALARYGVSDPKLLPIEAVHDYASPFEESEERERVYVRWLAMLHRLGVRTLGDFLLLPPKTLVTRLGMSALDVRNKISESGRIFWPIFMPPENWEEVLDLEDLLYMETLEPVLFLLRAMLSRLVSRLRGRGYRVSAMTLTLGKTRRLSLEFRHPQGSVPSLFSIIRERLTVELFRKPLEEPIEKLTLKVTETAPAESSQRDFFQQHEDYQENRATLVERLSVRVGRERVFQAVPVETYRPERAWARDVGECAGFVARAPGAVSAVSRPSRLLKYPEPLVRQDALLIHREMTKSWKVTAWHGPERVKGEWWSEPVARDYYRVTTAQGEELWVYRTPQSEYEYYLQGYFD
jgi:protein ImuB